MDLHAWLDQTEYRHPPESPPSIFDEQRPDSHHAVAKAWLRGRERTHDATHVRRRSPESYIHPFDCERVMLGCHNSRSSQEDDTQQAHDTARQLSTILLSSNVDTTSAHPEKIEDGSYRQRPRRKTRPDHYDFKHKHQVEQACKRRKRDCRRGKDRSAKHGVGDADRIRRSLALETTGSRRRMTVRMKSL